MEKPNTVFWNLVFRLSGKPFHFNQLMITKFFGFLMNIEMPEVSIIVKFLDILEIPRIIYYNQQSMIFIDCVHVIRVHSLYNIVNSGFFVNILNTLYLIQSVSVNPVSFIETGQP